MPSLINNSAVDSNAVSNPLSTVKKIFDQHPIIINIKEEKFRFSTEFQKNQQYRSRKSN